MSQSITDYLIPKIEAENAKFSPKQEPTPEPVPLAPEPEVLIKEAEPEIQVVELVEEVQPEETIVVEAEPEPLPEAV